MSSALTIGASEVRRQEAEVRKVIRECYRVLARLREQKKAILGYGDDFHDWKR